jgi:pilus assembly protein Flp/PilA
MGAALASFLHNDSGATAIEYGMLTALIAVGAIVAFGLTGGGLQNLFTGVSTKANESLTNASSVL